MQLCLSNLLDLALGKNDPNCLNFDLLHTLLHVVLRKSNLADTKIELCKETAQNVEKMLEDLPQEPSICFKDYFLKPDGCKIKKKSFHVAPKKSLTHISKKWPKCEVVDPSKNTLGELTNKFNCTSKLIHSKISKLEADVRKLFARNEKNEPIESCDLKVNISNKIEDSNTDSDFVDENEGKENFELEFLKEKVMELGDYLEMQSNCLKRLKCEEIPKIKSQQQKFMDDLYVKLFESKDDSGTCLKLEQLQSHFENLEVEMLCRREQIQKFEEAFCSYKDKIESELCSLKLMTTEKNCNNFANSNEELFLSEIINTQNLQKSEQKESSKCFSNKSFQIQTQNHENHSASASVLGSHNLINVHKENSANFSTLSLNELHEQMSSQNVCMRQLFRDLSSKVDHCEFEIYCRELNDLMDAFTQLRADICNSNVAAGCTIPLMKNMNCLSCQTSANMTITTTNVPKFPSIQFGYGRISSECCCEEFQSSQRDCSQVKKLQRRNGGSHTKISRKTIASRMKRRKISTPYRCSTPLTIFSNRYRKVSSHRQCSMQKAVL